MSQQILDEFRPILESMNNNILLQTSWIESMFMTDSLVKDNIEEQTDLLREMNEFFQRDERRRRLQDIPPPTTPVPDDTVEERGGDISPEVPGLGGIFTAGLIAPFAFSFIKGFLSEITEGLIELTPDGVLAALRLPSITKMLGNIGKTFVNLENIAEGSIGKIIDTAKDLTSKAGSILAPIFNPIKSVFNAASDLISGPLGKTLSFFTGGVTKIAGLFSKLVWPLSIIMGAIDGVREFKDAEGNTFERLGAGIGGFLGEIVGAPFDLIKNAINWILKKYFGIEVDQDGNALPGQGLMGWVVTKLNQFSFEETIGSLVTGAFSMVTDIVEWIQLLFTDPTQALSNLWEGLVGNFVSFGNWIFDNTISPAWNYIKGIFGWDSESDGAQETGFVADIFNDTIEKLKNFFKAVFDFIPSIEEVKATITSMLPAFMRPESIEEERARLEQELAEARERKRYYLSKSERARGNKAELAQRTIEDLEKQLSELPQLKMGGIFDAATSGSLAMLHGQEAVIPLDSSKGQRILQDKTNVISSNYGNQMAPIPVIVRGGDNVKGGNTVSNSGNTVTNITNIVDPTKSLSSGPAFAK